MKNSSANNRQIELDILRIFAMFAVVIVHTCGMNTQNMSADGSNKSILTLISALMTWEIPAFVMISGRFFLDPEREVSIKRVRRAIMRMCVAFVVWNLVYQFYYIFSGTYSDLNWKGILMQVIQGPYHFWYIYMIIGIYLLIPFLRRIAEKKWLMEYFIVLFIVFGTLTNYGPLLPIVGDTIGTISEHISFHFALGYTGYFVAGYYLHRYPLSEKYEIPIYIMGIVLWLGAAGLTVLYATYFDIHDELFVKYLMPNVAIESFAIYTFFIKRVSKWKFKPGLVALIEKLSEYSAGIYYIHALILELFALAGFSPLVASPLIMVPLLALLAVILSSVMIHMIRKIPRIGLKIT